MRAIKENLQFYKKKSKRYVVKNDNLVLFPTRMPFPVNTTKSESLTANFKDKIQQQQQIIIIRDP